MARALDEVRIHNDQARRFLTYVLRDFHRQHGDDAWWPIPDVAQVAGMSPSATERLLGSMKEDQEVELESCKTHGFTDERYRRNPNDADKGFWPAVRLLPRETVEARKRAIAERRKKLERASHLINEAIRVAYPAAEFRADVADSGRVTIVPIVEGADESQVIDLILAVDPAATRSREAPPQSRPAPRSKRTA